MVSDFGLYKERLPEFAASGNNFAVIRPEASGLDQAVSAWAKELKTNIIRADLGDGVSQEWFEEQRKTHRIFAVGVTANPALNLERLHERGDQTSDQELAATIQRYSRKMGFEAFVPYAERAVLLSSSDSGNIQTIYAAENGEQIYIHASEYRAFMDYAYEPVERLFQQPDGGSPVVRPS